MGLAWVASFAACYVVSHGILSKERFIWDWWDFAFLRLPPRSMAELKMRLLAGRERLRQPVGREDADGADPHRDARAGALGRGRMVAAAPVAGRPVSPGGPAGLRDGGLGAAPVSVPRPPADLPGARGAHAGGGGGGGGVAAGRLAVGGGAGRLPAVPAGRRRARGTGSSSRCSHGGYDSHGDLRPDLLDYLERWRGSDRDDRPRARPGPGPRPPPRRAHRVDPGRDRRGGRRACAATSSAG